MKKNSNAFILIKSLTMSEKRYFKIFSERHTIGEQNKYIALFDELDRAEKEVDTDLKLKLKKLGVNPDFISADKNYLYHLILRSLNVFHDSKTYNLEIKQSLISIEILFHKGLYHESLKLIAKAEELAKEQKLKEIISANDSVVEQPVKQVAETIVSEKKKLSYKEQKELESLDVELPQLETKKLEIETLLASGISDVKEIEKLSKQFTFISSQIDEKTMRWLELQD